MKHTLSLLLATGLLAGTAWGKAPAKQDETFAASTTAKKHSKLPCLFLALSDDEQVLELVKNLKFDLEFTDQIALDAKKYDKEIDPDAAGRLFKAGTSMLMQLKPTALATSKKPGSISISVHDTHSKQLLMQETFTYSPATIVASSHAIAEKILPALTGEPSPLSGTLAYCKQYSSLHKVICISDVCGKLEQVIVPNLTLNVAPRWHSQAPALFFTKFSQSNSQLRSVNLNSNKQKTICSYDGLNMQPSFSEDGKQVVLCMSAKRGNSEIYLYDRIASKKKKQRVFKQLTHNGGNNSSPCMLPNGNIIFCSDFQSGSPQVYLLDTQQHKVTRITDGKGYCAAPSYHSGTGNIVYTKLISGSFQLCSINLKDSRHREVQLTTGTGDKVDPTWSPCGRYIAFTYDKKDIVPGKRIPQIGILNCASKTIRVVTHGSQPKSFPTWTEKPFYNA